MPDIAGGLYAGGEESVESMLDGMTWKKKLPIGIENFEEIRTEGFYYVDKTGLIRDLLYNWGKVNLITRPRRFGKSLNMSMLKSFFEIGCRRELFDGLKISEEPELCEKYMGNFPVLSISLKGANAQDFNSAKAMLRRILNEETDRIQKMISADALNRYQREALERLLDNEMSDADLMNSLRMLSAILFQYYQKKVIILIDEYDVPLAKANEKGYYDEMVVLLRNMFEHALETNDNLYFAVLTGCLRIAKESIFTGLNNLKVLSITDVQFDEYFGFSDSEVRKLLEYYNLSEHYVSVKEWYDGYCFGNVEVYCPWDVICYCDKLRMNPNAKPETYWSNTSGNDIIRHFIDGANAGTKQEIEKLISGECVAKAVRQEMTYKELYQSVDNMWSVLFMTGYLTRKEELKDGRVLLAIPNTEIRSIFDEQISEWFMDRVRRDGKSLEIFCEALKSGNVGLAEKKFGLLSYKDTWYISSNNKETGAGYSDIFVEINGENIGIIIEIKYSENEDLEGKCREALRQIEEKDYASRMRIDGIRTVLKYGVACRRKTCKMLLEQGEL